MAEEKKYTGYGYHGGGRPKAEVPIKKFSISAKLPDYELIKTEAEKQGMSISKYLILAGLEKIKKFYKITNKTSTSPISQSDDDGINGRT